MQYTWSTISKPLGAADPLFSRNASNVARTADVTFAGAGQYTLQLAVTDGELNSSSATFNVQVDIPAPNADFNQDGNVDGLDYGIWQTGFGLTGHSATRATGDANRDGAVDAADYSIWRDNTTGPGASSAIATGAIPVSAEPVATSRSTAPAIGIVLGLGETSTSTRGHSRVPVASVDDALEILDSKSRYRVERPASNAAIQIGSEHRQSETILSPASHAAVWSEWECDRPFARKRIEGGIKGLKLSTN